MLASPPIREGAPGISWLHDEGIARTTIFRPCFISIGEERKVLLRDDLLKLYFLQVTSSIYIIPVGRDITRGDVIAISARKVRIVSYSSCSGQYPRLSQISRSISSASSAKD